MPSSTDVTVTIKSNIVVPFVRSNEPDRNWGCIAASDDGTKLVGSDLDGNIYMSNNFGETWINRLTVDNWYIKDIACSSDRTIIYAVGGESFRIRRSVDSGVTWTQHEDERDWTGITCSSDGKKVVAIADYDHIYCSSDQGETWVKNGPQRNWSFVRSSTDGSQVHATAYDFENGSEYYRSTNGGIDWLGQKVTVTYDSLALSADGKTVVALVNSSVPSLENDMFLQAMATQRKIQLSHDAGNSWITINNFQHH